MQDFSLSPYNFSSCQIILIFQQVDIFCNILKIYLFKLAYL